MWPEAGVNTLPRYRFLWPGRSPSIPTPKETSRPVKRGSASVRRTKWTGSASASPRSKPTSQTPDPKPCGARNRSPLTPSRRSVERLTSEPRRARSGSSGARCSASRTTGPRRQPRGGMAVEIMATTGAIGRRSSSAPGRTTEMVGQCRSPPRPRQYRILAAGLVPRLRSPLQLPYRRRRRPLREER